MNKLLKAKVRTKKRLGRGYGSGKGGHTSGRGQKGQKSRGKVGILFEGIKVKKSLLRRLPMKRGKDKNFPRIKPLIIKTDELNQFKDGDTITIETLNKMGIIESVSSEVKILSGKEVKKKLTVEVSTSNSARELIEKAGGKVIK